MRFTRLSNLAMTWMIALVVVQTAQAAITSFAGSVRVQVRETAFGQSGDSDLVDEDFPGTSNELPIFAIAQLRAAEPEEAAAAVAAQFDDPTELVTPNPEEFAINLALLSVSPHIRYQANARTQEVREVVFSPAEVGGNAAGTEVQLIGRLFIDGALALFAVDSNRDMTGAAVTLRVTVVQSGGGVNGGVVFSGTLNFSGGSGGAATATTEGSFPRATLIQSDLAPVNPDFGVLQVLIIPPLTIDYTYRAIVGEPLTLTATVEIEAANIAGEVGVAAIVGTPVDTLNDVIALTQSVGVAQRFVSQITQERSSPTGRLIFTEQPMTPVGLCPLVAMASLVALTFGAVATGRRRSRR